MERRLVTFRTVNAIKSIEGADMIELAIVDGWQVVVSKGEFKVGDVGVFYEIDSFLEERPEYEFLRKSSFRVMGEEKGFRLKTCKMRGQISQGLLLPISKIGLTGSENEDTLAEILGVKKYDPPISGDLASIAKGNFPEFIPKTDQERVQNLVGKLWGTGRIITYTDAQGNEVTKELPAATKRLYEVSEKMDGSSTTIYNYYENFGVCSRNLDLIEDESNTYWQMAYKHQIKERLKGINVALQGEMVGEAIQSNPYKLKGKDLYIFDIYDIDKRRYFSPDERASFLKEMLPELKSVPLIARNFELPQTLTELLEFVQGHSALAPREREGLVFKEEGISLDRFSFKGISNKYLLGLKD